MGTGRLSPVVWTEGMFLRPQHFQQHHNFLEERLRYHLGTVSPYFWGVRNLVINEDQLTANTFEIQQLEAVLPSGTIVRTGENAVIEPRAFDPTEDRISVYLALRVVGESEAGMTAEQGESGDVRFEIRGRELPDRTRVGAIASVDLAYARLRIFFTKEEKELEVYEHFKLGEVVAAGEKHRFELSRDVAPPLLSLQAFAPLNDLVAQTVALLKARLIRVAGRTSGTLAVAELPKYWMRYTLASAIPRLEHLLASGSTHPYDVFTTLVDCAGALSAFNIEGAAELPRYEHEDLMGSFTALAAFLEAQLEEAIPDRFKRVDVAFDAEKSLYYSSALNSDLVSPHNTYYLAVKSNLEVEDLVHRMTNDAKAGALSTVKLGLRANLAGVPIEHLAAPPTEVELLAGYQYFSLDPNHAKWKKITEDYDFALSLPNVESADVRLYIVTGAS